MFRNTPYALRDGVEAVVRVDNDYLHFYRDGRYYRMRDSTKQFVNFPNGLSYRDVIDTLIPQCRSLNLSLENEGCSNSSEWNDILLGTFPLSTTGNDPSEE